jgi:hypothetical protein
MRLWWQEQERNQVGVGQNSFQFGQNVFRLGQPHEINSNCVFKFKGLKARKIIAQDKASLRVTPWVNRSQDFSKPWKGGRNNSLANHNLSRATHLK